MNIAVSLPLCLRPSAHRRMRASSFCCSHTRVFAVRNLSSGDTPALALATAPVLVTATGTAPPVGRTPAPAPGRGRRLAAGGPVRAPKRRCVMLRP